MGERERERETDRQTDRQTDREAGQVIRHVVEGRISLHGVEITDHF